MLKNISNLGKTLSKKEQTSIDGGCVPPGSDSVNGGNGSSCPSGYCRNYSGGCTNLTTAIFYDCVPS